GSSTETTSGYSAATKPIDQKPASTTLLNKWLRSESEAFNPWDIGGDVRTRYELRQDAGSFPQSDFIRNAVNDNDYLELRTKIHLRYKPVDWVNLFVEGRDARNWGDSRPVIPSNDSFDLYQAYFQMGNPKDYPLLLKVGRQEMTYGDERFVGVSDWNNAGRSFDAA